jgi:RND family efflux transporter MFP subunit
MRIISSCVCSGVLLSLVVGCDRPSPSPAEPASASQAPSVKVVHPERKTVRRLIERPGYNVEADEKTPLYAKLPGYVLRWNRSADLGAHVRKDDVLAELDIPEMDVELEQKKAGVEQARSEIKQAEAAVLRAQADEKRAKSQYERLSQVGSSSGGLISKDQVEEYRLGYEAAQTATAKAVADKEVAEKRLKVAEANRAHVGALLQYKQIKAPYDGIITERNVNTRDLADPTAITKGKPLFVVEKINPVRVFINIPEMDAVWVRDGDTAFIRAQSLRGQQFQGTVTRSSGTLNPVNRTLRTEIDLPNDDGTLRPGMFVDATIVVEHKNVWSLPAAAVMTTPEGQTFCYRVEDGKAIRTPIQVGLRGDDLIEVLKKQTKSGEDGPREDFTGEEVIVGGDAASISDGQAVTKD